MTRLTVPGTRKRWRAGIRGLVAMMAVAGLLGAAAQAQAHVTRDRLALEARVAVLREEIQQADRSDSAQPPSGRQLAQWFNWGNWNNWNNWRNWGNWGNWPNWLNR